MDMDLGELDFGNENSDLKDNGNFGEYSTENNNPKLQKIFG